jgi:hypothetical protein
MVAGAYFLAVSYAEALPAICGGHEAWRYTLLSGLFPAIPLLAVRPFLPESQMWRDDHQAGNLRRPKITELFQPAFRRTTLAATALIACSSALAFGAIQQATRIVPGLPDMRGLSGKQVEHAVSTLQVFQEIGGFAGRILFVLLVVRIISQRRLLRSFLAPALLLFPGVLFLGATRQLIFLQLGIFCATLLFNAMHSFWGNYLPRMYPTRLRATGQAFAVNVGARVIGVFAALLTANLATVMPGGNPSTSLAYAAGAVATCACIAGLIAIQRLPEPRSRHLLDRA